MNARKHSRGRAGFTLVELMIALVAGSFVVSGAYYLSDVSARLFNEQMRRSETQMTLRTASEQLRRDIGRAALLGARDTAELWGCNGIQGDASVSPTRQQGVRVVANAGGGVSLFLTGNFTTSDQYPITVNSNANMLELDINRESFRRSFVDPTDQGNNLFLPQRFLSAFAPNPASPAVPQGRMVSIQDLSTGRIYLRDIISLNPNVAGPQIFIAPALPTVGGCIPSLTTLVVSPLSTMRYTLEAPTAADPDLNRFAQTTNALAGGARLLLTRREINMTTNNAATPTAIANTTRIVLDFVSAANGFNSFRIEAYYDRSTVIGAARTNPVLLYTATPQVGIQPVQLRSLLIDLVGESAESAGAGDRESRRAAGRRLARMEVFMPNMARNPGVQ